MDKIHLTEKQKNNSLSARKKVKAPRNVLTSSLPEYWPTLNESNTDELSLILKSVADDVAYKSFTSFGLESALRNAKNCGIKFLLLDDNITPRWFGKHFIAMALNRDSSVKIIIVPKLKDMTKEIFKISTIVFCINNDLVLLEEFYKKINVHDEFLKHYRHTSIELREPAQRRKRKVKSTQRTPIVYLKKESDQPAFVPTNQSDIMMEAESTEDFISIKKYVEPSKKIIFDPISYHPMKIKQVFPNPNRKKK